MSTTYTYAGSDQNELLNQATPSGDNYSYIYGRPDQHGLPVIEKVKRGTITAHIDHDPTGTPIMLRYSSGTVALYLYDGRGNPIGLVTEYATTGSAYDYDPYGVQTLTTGSPTGLPVLEDPFTYQGGTRDRVTGHIKYGQRWYDPDNGRFTQQDTLDAPLNPHNANRYTYAGADPINNADPTGRGFLADAIQNVTGCALGVIGVVETGVAEAALVIGPEGPALVASTACVVGAVAEDAVMQ